MDDQVRAQSNLKQLMLPHGKRQRIDENAVAVSGAESSENRLPPPEWNWTSADFPAHSCIHELVEAQAQRTPDLIAVRFDDRQLTYADLDRNADRLAHRLRQLGAGPEVLVGLCAHRSLEMAEAVLGILKAGAAYVPLDPAYPKARLEFILRDARIPVLLSQRRVQARLPPLDCELALIDDGESARSARTPNHPSTRDRATPDSLAYVIYTSGSTGNPKGVGVAHRSLCNLTWWQIRNSVLGQGSRTLQLASLSFDVSVQEIFATWCSGGTLVLVSESLRRDPDRLLDHIRREAVERIFLPFSGLQQLAVVAARNPGLPVSLREIVTAGEQLRITPEISRWLGALPDCTLYNQYGPTETHVVVTSHAMKGNPARWPVLPPLGRPIANTRIYVLDEDRRPVPVETLGELYIGGVCLARGYLHRPDLTADRFVPDPFSDDPASRLYRTGDLGRYRADGNIEFLGRIDHQVKVRGFRIELGEIEATLDQHPHVRQAVVVAREDTPGSKRLIAYVATAEHPEPSMSELRQFVSERLPEYMVPSVFVILEALPLTSSGKVDRQSLPPPADIRTARTRGFVGPRTPIEQRVARIWSEVLELDAIGMEDNFFDLGGDSLLATAVVARVETSFNVRFLHRWLLEDPTVKSMAARLEDLRPQEARRADLIPQAARDEPIPLSFVQEEIWLMARRYAELPLYNEPFVVHMAHAVDAAALERALNALIERHEILRTGFLVRDGRPLQRVHPRAPVTLSFVDPRPLVGADRTRAVVARAEEEARRVFDLSQPPLLRALLARLDVNEYQLYLVIHHIVIDAVGVYKVLVPELSALYLAACEGSDAHLPALPMQYADFARWQRTQANGALLEANLAYWVEQLSDAPPFRLPGDLPPSLPPTRRGAFEPFSLTPSLSTRLKTFARGQGVTLYVVLLAAFMALLWRHTRQGTLVIATAEAGRCRREFEALLGYFVNTLVIRTDVSGEQSFVQLLRSVQLHAIEAQEHKDCPLTKLTERLRSLGQAAQPLFQVLFVMEPSLPDYESGWKVSQLVVQTGTSKFDLTVEMEARDCIIGRFEYASDLFEAATIRRLIDQFSYLLQGIVDDPERRLSELPLMSEEERRRILAKGNGPAVDYPRDRCIHQLFEAQANLCPNATAVVCGKKQLTYRELNGRANRLAHHLRSLGVGPDVAVGVYGNRSLPTVVALLAVLKAGGAYVPLDPAYPKPRLAFMLEDAGVRVLLAQPGLSLPNFTGTAVVLDDDGAAFAAQSSANPELETNAEGLAYVMYTSGSTGVPKGVAVPHRAVVRLLCSADYVELNRGQVFLLLAPLGFDASTFELWGALLHGARCVVVPERTPSSRALGRLISEQGVTTVWLTAALFNKVIDEAPETLAPLRQLLTGGEALSVAHVRRALQLLPNTRLINGYGPTEGTTFTCCYAIPRTFSAASNSVLIGRPIANTKVCLLDEHRNLVPTGVPGELYIGGDGLARGYVNRPELTSERFVFGPFGGDPNTRWYRTGDRARLLTDGNFEFLGRVDDQVKIRGFRVEPGEIEATLTAQPGVREAVVLAREKTAGNKQLHAFVTLAPGQRQTPADLRKALQARLPDYMIPTAVLVLESMPLAANGKVDRAALAEVAAANTSNGALVTPRDAVEVQVMRIWEALLEQYPLGVTDDFFDCGGDSLLAMQVIDRLNQLFGRELPVDALWHGGRTIEGLAAMLRADAGEGGRIWSRAVPIRPGGSRRPLFCAPIIGGHLHYYDDLARHLDADRPVYGLPAQGTDSREPPHTTFEAMAAHGIRLMREVQPIGPYALLGYCSAGLVAFEMARQLVAHGETVALLALVDSSAPGAVLRLWADLIPAAARGKDWRLLQERLYHLVLKSLALGRLRRFKKPGEAHRWALWSYQPACFAGRAVLIRPSNGADVRDPASGWSRYIRGGIEVRTLEGQHGDLVKGNGAACLAAELAQWLN